MIAMLMENTLGLILGAFVGVGLFLYVVDWIDDLIARRRDCK